MNNTIQLKLEKFCYPALGRHPLWQSLMLSKIVLSSTGASIKLQKTGSGFGGYNIHILCHLSKCPDFNYFVDAVWHKLKQSFENNPKRTLAEFGRNSA